MSKITLEWEKKKSNLLQPTPPAQWKTVTLGDKSLFALRIGKRVLKKEVYRSSSGIPLYSANIRKTFGLVEKANAGGLEHGGALWSIDSDFDCRAVAPGDLYAITDHCGQIALLDATVEPRYLAQQIRQAGLDYGFNREFRPSLKLMASLEIELPITEGKFDYGAMQAWSDYRDELERIESEFSALLI
jgi:type I restriction enzyme M protein